MLSFSFSLEFGLSHLAFPIPSYSHNSDPHILNYCLNSQLLFVPHSEGPVLGIQGTPSSLFQPDWCWEVSSQGQARHEMGGVVALWCIDAARSQRGGEVKTQVFSMFSNPQGLLVFRQIES